MKLSLLTACTLAVAVAESTLAAPFPSDYHGAAARDLEARAFELAFDDGSYLAARSPLLGKSRSSSALKPTTHESVPLQRMPTTGGGSSHASSSKQQPAPAAPKPENKGKGPAPPQPPPKNPARYKDGLVPKPLSVPNKKRPSSSPEPPSTPKPPPSPKPSSAEQTEEERKKQHDAQTLATSKESLEETKKNNAATQAHNAKMRKLGYAGLGLTALGGATAIGLGINTAIETHNKNQFDEQQKTQAAQAQPARRAIIDGEVYELYWVN